MDAKEVSGIFSNFNSGLAAIVRVDPKMKQYTDKIRRLVAQGDSKGLKKMQADMLKHINELKSRNDQGNKS